MKRTKKVLWQTGKFFNYFLGIVLILLIVYLIFITYDSKSRFVISLMIILSILFIYMALCCFFIKNLKITEEGVFLGNGYFKHKPGTIDFGLSVFALIFKKSKFISWKEIKAFSYEEVVYFYPLKLGIWILVPLFQKFLVVKTYSNETFWLPFSMGTDSYKRKVVDIDALLASKGKRIVIAENKERKSLAWLLIGIFIVLLIVGFCIYTIYIDLPAKQKEALIEGMALECAMRCSSQKIVDSFGKYKYALNETCFDECLKEVGIEEEVNIKALAEKIRRKVGKNG